MPANKRHLSTRGQRISKTLAGIIGGYIVTMALHLLVAVIWSASPAWIQTTTYSAFSMWVAAIIVALLFKSAWKIWSLYGIISLISFTLIYLLR